MHLQLLGEFKSRLGWDAGLLRASCKLRASPLGPTVGVWGLQAGSRWGFGSSLHTTSLNCSQFSCQCDDVCCRAESVKLRGCWLPNPLAVLPGVFNGICVGLGINWRQPRLLHGSLALRLGPLCCACSFWAGALLAAERDRLHQLFLFNGATLSRLGFGPNRQIALAQLQK